MSFLSVCIHVSSPSEDTVHLGLGNIPMSFFQIDYLFKDAIHRYVYTLRESGGGLQHTNFGRKTIQSIIIAFSGRKPTASMCLYPHMVNKYSCLELDSIGFVCEKDKMIRNVTGLLLCKEGCHPQSARYRQFEALPGTKPIGHVS